jgi:hypothetical protein
MIRDHRGFVAHPPLVDEALAVQERNPRLNPPIPRPATILRLAA